MAKSAKLKNKAGVVLYPMTCTDMVLDTEKGIPLSERLDAMKHMVYLGEFTTSGEGESEAVQYASNRKISLITYDVKNKSSARIEQAFSNTDSTIQYLYYDGHRYVRKIAWAKNEVSRWVDVTGAERIKKLSFDQTSNSLSFEDSLNSQVKWGAVTIPLPGAQDNGTVATRDSNLYIYRGSASGSEDVSTDVLADVDIVTDANGVQIVGKSWGTKDWQPLTFINAATSTSAGVMSNIQCQSLEEVANFLSKLKEASGITDIDELVDRLVGTNI